MLLLIASDLGLQMHATKIKVEFTSVNQSDLVGYFSASNDHMRYKVFFFTAAFVFNWVGFVLLLCFCHTVAGRTGALAGFGLSLAKWAVIVRHSTDLVADSNTWLLWLIMALGKDFEAVGIFKIKVEH